MQSIFKNKTVKLAISVIVALAVGLLVFWGNAQRARANQYGNRLQSVYDKSVDVIADDLSKIETTLAKIMVVKSNKQYNELLQDVWKFCSKASGELGQLPASYVDFSPLSRYFTQLGDYSHSIMGALAEGGSVTDADIEQLLSMYNICVDINNKLGQAREGGKSLFDSTSFSSKNKDNQHYFDAAKNNTVTFKEDGGDHLYPSLIYDGPFSDSTQKAKPAGLDAKKYSQQEAQQIAKDILGDTIKGELKVLSENLSKLEGYGFEEKTKQDKSLSLYITKQGGHLLWLKFDSKSTDESQIQPKEVFEQLSKIGSEYIASVGYVSMEPTYAQYYSSQVLINYAYVQNGVIIYEDLVKVWIDLETKQVVGVDARNYLFSHVERNIPPEKLSPDQAQELVSKKLKITSVKRAFIPISRTQERFCYEFTGNFGEDTFIIYINAITGAEEQIYKIINSKTGQLVL